MKRLGLIIAIVACASTALGQQRVHRDGGYWQFNKTGCGYQWQWYATPSYKAPNYESKVFNYVWNNYGAKAEQGSTAYSVGNYDPLSLYAPADSAALATLAEKFVEGGVKIGGSAFTLASRESSDRLSVARDALQVERIKALALVAEKTQPGESVVDAVASVEAHVSAEVKTDAPVNLAGVEKKCAGCHGGDAASGGDVKLPAFAEMSKEQAKLAFDYVTTLEERNCAGKAKLNASEHAALLDYLCEKK